MILPAGNANVFVEQIFRIFDKDGNGSIDFKVTISLSSVCTYISIILFSIRKKSQGPISLIEKEMNT